MDNTQRSYDTALATITPADFRLAVAVIGGTAATAELLGVNERNLGRYCAGASTPPPGLVRDLFGVAATHMQGWLERNG